MPTGLLHCTNNTLQICISPNVTFPMVIWPLVPEFESFMNASWCSTRHCCSEPPWQSTAYYYYYYYYQGRNYYAILPKEGTNMQYYTVNHENVPPNFCPYLRQILTNLENSFTTHYADNLRHHTQNVSLHYLVKFKLSAHKLQKMWSW